MIVAAFLMCDGSEFSPDRRAKFAVSKFLIEKLDSIRLAAARPDSISLPAGYSRQCFPKFLAGVSHRDAGIGLGTRFPLHGWFA